MSTKNSIQVGIKVRPVLPKERDALCVWQVKANSIYQIDSLSEPYSFDYIFDQHASNQLIFETMAKNIVHACVHGFNGTIFAYGQTSSGKTYTMMGNEQNPGVMVLAAKEIFQQIQHDKEREFLLRVGYIEIYNEKIYDLLNKKNTDLKIKEYNMGTVSVNCEENIITSEEELLQYLCLGNKERTVGETNMNERSSRSHAIFRIIIESRKADQSVDDTVQQSVLNLVDLAGSERADQTGARGARLKEGGHINKSLLFLSNVIKRLSENEDHKYISYRDSKLTRILQASLGGNALTAVICTIKPTTVEETQSTLSFAMRAKAIKNKPQRNEIVSEATLMKRLEREIKQLKNQLDEERRKNESQHTVGQLEERLKTDMLKIISGNSLNNVRNQKDKRRRTWCPTSSLPILTGMTSGLPAPQFSSGLMAPRYQLPKPSFFTSQNVTPRDVPKTINIFKSLNAAQDLQGAVEEEEFQPAEHIDFERMPSPFNTPNLQNVKDRTKLEHISLTPTFKQLGAKSLEIIENELLELQKFTNLEKQIEVKHECFEALKEKLEIVSSERDRLANERLTYIEMKADFNDAEQNLIDCEKRCDELQIQISKLTHAHQIAEGKISQFEQQVTELKKTNAKLDLENRETVSLEFEFETHKNKAKQREKELLALLSEKDCEIGKLQQKLDEVAADILRNTKDDIMQASRIVSETEKEDEENICVKCEDLERLLEENKKVTAEFENLTEKYEKLQLSYQQMAEDSEKTQCKLNELEQSRNQEAGKCEQLLDEIECIRAKLMEVQLSYEQKSNECNEKVKACDELDGIVAASQEELRLLQDKCDRLEQVREEQQKAIEDIKTEYTVIQMKYQKLQAEYELLEESSMKSKEFSDGLQQKNQSLQQEISSLKLRVEEMQCSLLDYTEQNQTNGVACVDELNEVKHRNLQLQAALTKSQEQFNGLQQEYDDLSNQLLESIQEGDAMREKLHSLEEKLKLQMNTPAMGTTSLKASSCDSDTDSMRSSGICTESSEHDADFELLSKFMLLCESLYEIELELKTGLSRKFRLSENTTSPYKSARKLLIYNIQEIISQCDSRWNGENESNGNVLIQGYIKQHHFQIVDTPNATVENDTKDALICRLQQEINEKDQLFEATINEMREQMGNLESALLEKTMIAETLEKHVKECTMGDSFMRDVSMANDTLSSGNAEATKEVIERMRTLENEFEAKFIELQETHKTEINELQQSKDELLKEQRAEMTCLESNKILALETVQELQTKLYASAAEYDRQLQLTIQKYSERCNNADANKQDMEQKLQDLEERLREKSTELQTNLALIEKMKKETENLELAVQCATRNDAETTLQQEICQLKNELSKAKMEADKAEKRYRDELNNIDLELYQKLELSEAEYRKNIRKYNTEWEQSKSSYEQQIDDLTQKLSTNEQELVKVQCRFDKLTTEHEQALIEKTLLVEQLEKANTEFDQYQSSFNQQIENLTTNKHQQLMEIQSKFDKLNAEHQGVIVEKSRIKEQWEQVNTTLDQVKLNYDQQVDDLTQKLVANEQKFLEVQGKYVTLIAEHEQTLLKKALVVDQLEQAKIELSSLCDGRQTELQQMQTYKDEMQKLNAIIESLHTKCQNLQAQYDVIKCEYGQYTTNANAKIETLQAVNDQQTEDCTKYKAEWEQGKLSYEQKIDDLTQKFYEKEQQLLKIQCRFDKLNKDHEEALAEKTHANEQIKTQTDDLLKQKAECSNLSSSLQQVHSEKKEVESQLEQCHKEKLSLQHEIADLATTKTEIDNRLDKLNIENMELKLELERCQTEMHNLHQKSFANELLAAENQKLKTQLESLETECASVKSTQFDYERLQNKYEASLKDAQHIKQELQQLQAQSEKYRLAAEEKAETLQLKIKNLMSDLQGALTKAANYDSLLHLQEKTEKELADSNAAKMSLAEQVKQVEAKFAYVAAQAEQRRIQEIATLQTELENKRLDLVKANEAQSAICEQLKSVQASSMEICHASQREAQDLRSRFTELELKCDALQAEKSKIDATNQQLTALLHNADEKNTECENLRKVLEQHKEQHNELEKRIAHINSEAGKTNAELCDQLKRTERVAEESKEAYAKLRAQWNSKEAAYKKTTQQLEGTISCLLSEKKNLQERLELTESIVKRLQSELPTLQRKSDSANASFDSNQSLSSPMGRRSIDRMTFEANQFKSNNVQLEDKLHAIQQKSMQMETECRRNRRLSTHDERRRQSYWVATRDMASMTVPMDPGCKCVELNQKLQDCERKLYLSEGLVKTLRMDIKNHPLKDENAILKKRLLEEQEKIKKIKLKNHELSAKINALNVSSAANKVSKQSSTAAEDSSVDTVVAPKVVCNAETQTVSDLNTCLQDLQGKYQDAVSVLRFRYKLIKDLEEKLAEKDNSENSNMSSLQLGQISALKSQNELLKKEIKGIKEKYENAKIVIINRRLEVEKLRQQISQALDNGERSNQNAHPA